LSKSKKNPSPLPQATEPQPCPQFRLSPRNETQKTYIETIRNKELTFGLGPAGTGKTFLAVAAAVEAFTDKRVERIILVRPAVEAGEKLGFLPGTLQEKVDPYLRPLYDALYEMLPSDRVKKLLEDQTIEAAPLAFMRGRTLKNAFIILDEAQNTTPDQMKMFLTRIGEGSRTVVTGDLSQHDLPKNIKSGLADAVRLLSKIPEIGICEFTEAEVVRHRLVRKIVAAYDADQQLR